MVRFKGVVMTVCSLIVAPGSSDRVRASLLRGAAPPRVDAEPCLRSDTQTSREDCA